MYFTQEASYIPTAINKFRREKCRDKIGEFFVEYVLNKYWSPVFTSGLCDTFISSLAASSHSLEKSQIFKVQSKLPENKFDLITKMFYFFVIL